MEKKLIYVLNSYSKNSVQHFFHVENLLRQMADNGIQIALVIEKTDGEVLIDHPNIRVICQKENKKVARVLELVGILNMLMKQGYRKVFIRISINSAIISILTGAFRGGKVYYWQSGTTLEVDADKHGLRKLKWLLCDYSRLWFVKSFSYRFVTGPEYMVDYYSHALKIPKKRILMLYNDIDIDRFTQHTPEEKAKLRHQLGIAQDEYIVLMVHRLSPVRKTDMYIPRIMEDEFFRDKRIRLLIIGDGPERPLLERLTRNSAARDRISFLGSKPNKELQDYYAIADLFVNPSYTEGFPRVVIEAMACGLPVVATNAGGTADLFGPLQTLYVTDKNDPSLIAEKIAEIYENSSLAADLAQENLQISRRYSTQAVAKQYECGLFTAE